MNTENRVLLELIENVAVLTINRPDKLNSLNAEILFKIDEYLNELSLNDNIRTVIIKGAGKKSFSSGYDISEIPGDIPDSLQNILKSKNPLQVGLEAVENYPYPVIAMINGYALGGGLELAVTCDIRVASENSIMGIPPSKLGLIYQPDGINKFINIIGYANSMELFLTGRFYDITGIKRMGLVNHVVKESEINKFTLDLACEIASNAPLSLKGHKKIFKKLMFKNILNESDMEEFNRLIKEAFNSEDFKEGSEAFLSKRKPLFKGR